MRKTASLYTLGCRLNQAETHLLGEQLRAAGYELVPFGEPAQLGVIHTCTVTGEADSKSRKAIRAFIRRNPKAFVAVLGCYSQLAAEAIAAIEGVDLILGTEEKMRLASYLRDEKNGAPVVAVAPPRRGDFTLAVSGGEPVTRRANLKIQDGCACGCSYCVVPLARGGPRSRDIDNLIEEARGLVDRGAKEIVLTGVNVGAYESRGIRLPGMIERLCMIAGLARIRIGSIEVTQTGGALLEWMGDPAHPLMPFLHVPLQSGSDAVLRRMNRPYTAAEFRVFLELAAQTPGLCVGTDVLVGFPGESAADFDATCHLIRDTCIAYTHVFKFSPRPGTAAACFEERVDARIAHERSVEVQRIGETKHRDFLQRNIGKTLPVLFESIEDGCWQGYTPNYIRAAVAFAGDLTNVIRPAVLEEIRGAVVFGRIVDE